KMADSERKSGKTVKNVIYWGNQVMRFAKKTACLAIVAGTRFVQRFLREREFSASYQHSAIAQN
ncbi:MAG TPA: hypothetical protein VIF37_12795, partial [Methylobacter sp.]